VFEVQRINDTRHIHKKIVDNHEPEKRKVTSCIRMFFISGYG